MTRILKRNSQRAPEQNATVCSVCGAEEYFADYTDCQTLRYMIAHNVCYSCAYWLLQAENPDTCDEVVDGELWTFNPIANKPDNVIKGWFGKEFFIWRTNGNVARSNNVWNKGKVPERFKDKFPDTAHQISQTTYAKLRLSPDKCEAIGCWDRYRCSRYNMECEKDGAFNKVPKSHKIGSENCPAFINKKEFGL